LKYAFVNILLLVFTEVKKILENLFLTMKVTGFFSNAVLVEFL